MLIKGATQIIENDTRKQRGGFPVVLWGTLGAILFVNMLAGKGLIRAGNGVTRTGQDFQFHLSLWLILKHKSIIKMNLNIKVFINEIIYQKSL